MHTDIEPLQALIGRWAGEGRGDYPTIEPFTYREEATFVNPPGKPFLVYNQRTWALDDGRPLHVESGYIRAGADGAWEWVNAEPTGFVEVYRGVLEHGVLTFTSTLVGRTPTAKRVDEVLRVLRFAPDELTYELEMAAVGHPLRHHLTARLLRVAD